jgi:hypothetical protein
MEPLLPHEKEFLKKEIRESIFEIDDIAFILKCIANSKIDGIDLQQAVITVDKLQKKYRDFKIIEEKKPNKDIIAKDKQY